MDHTEEPQRKTGKQHNILPLWGSEATMNLNPLILTNIQSSSYFKVSLFKLKTYHEIVDEIYYQVKHLEPWEKGSRKTAGQTGMCGGVRGVGSGGIVSSAYCLLYKLYTLKLTRKQVNGLLTHTDSPFIRALGFMYIRYTQPPSDLFDWYEAYLQDEEEIDVKAGGGQTMYIGSMLRQWMVKLDWFSTLFPRIPVPMQKQIEKRLEEYAKYNNLNFNQSFVAKEISTGNNSGGRRREENDYYPVEEKSSDRDRGDRGRSDRERDRDGYRDDRRVRSRSRERVRTRDRDYDREYDRERADRSDRGERRERDHHREYNKYSDRDYKHKERSDRDRKYKQ